MSRGPRPETLEENKGSQIGQQVEMCPVGLGCLSVEQLHKLSWAFVNKWDICVHICPYTHTSPNRESLMKLKNLYF